MTPPPTRLDDFGRIDIYVFDQLLRGNLRADQRILDAGCGSGRNVEYLMRQGADVFGVDADPAAIARAREVQSRVAPGRPGERFSVGRLSALPFRDGFFGAVLCSAVLHFAEDEHDFETMLSEMWRVLEPGGLFFARLASNIGLGGAEQPIRGRWHALPDGSERFLVDEAYLVSLTAELGGFWVDPLKTTVVQGMRSMTTWVLRK